MTKKQDSHVVKTTITVDEGAPFFSGTCKALFSGAEVSQCGSDEEVWCHIASLARNVAVCCSGTNKVETKRRERIGGEKESGSTRGNNGVEMERHRERLQCQQLGSFSVVRAKARDFE
ncbi:hypothetical protein JHK87_050591 [Glycine soja]|nr:hypothetical protein JHK87_050591 [Glycine soja]